MEGLQFSHIIVEVDPEEFPFHDKKLKEEGNVLPVEAEDTSLLMYTSGTTGKSKGVFLSQRNLISGGLNVVESH